MVTTRERLLDSMNRKLRAVKHMVITLPMDGATPHTGKGNLDNLRAAGKVGILYLMLSPRRALI